MYIPKHFRNENREELIAFLEAHPFAVIVSNGATVPFATHLPFVTGQQDGKIFLYSHFSAANPHAHALNEDADVLVIFSGDDSYISPSLYDKKENVPTWNYIAVHAHGKLRKGIPEAMTEKVLQRMIACFEPAYQSQWESLSAEYTDRLKKGIVAFHIEVINLEGKFKLSQNKTESEQQRIAQHLSGTELSDYMNKKNS